MNKTKNQRTEIKETAKWMRNEGREFHDLDFVLETNGAERVYLCGDCNDWKPPSLRIIGNPEAGLWEKHLTGPGKLQLQVQRRRQKDS